MWRSSGCDLANGVGAGWCGRRGSLDLPDTVRPTLGCRADQRAAAAYGTPLVPITTESPEKPWLMSVVRLGSSSTCRRFGALDMTNAAPLVEIAGLYSTRVSA